jgi:sulfopyruvate decarboxylase subunit beta
MTSCSEYLQSLAKRITDDLVISSIGRVTIEWRKASPERDGNFFGVYMSGATAIATGLALALPKRRVIALDGDGAILMNLSVFLTIGQKLPGNLTVIVGDNEAYEQTRSVPTFTAGAADIEKIARGAGITKAFTVRTVAEFNAALEASEKGPSGPTLIVMKMSGETISDDALFISMDLVENKYRFGRHIEETEGVTIFRPTGMTMPEPMWPLAK